MSLVVNLRQVAKDNLFLTGEVPVSELDIDPRDAMIRVGPPLRHDLEVQKSEANLLIRGRLSLVLDCQCVRCLKPFQFHLELADWACLLPLEGEDAVPVVNDCVDLTPPIREDILLEFPRHPLCRPECSGLAKVKTVKAKKNSDGQTKSSSSAWTELDKLKL